MIEQQIEKFFRRNETEVPVYIDGDNECKVGVTSSNLKKALRSLESGNVGRAKFIVKEGITDNEFISFLKRFIAMDSELITNSVINKADKLLKIADYFYTNHHTQLVADDDLYQSAVAKLQAIKGGVVERGFVKPSRMDGKVAKHLFENLSGTIDKIFGINDNDNEKDSGKKSLEWFIGRPFKDGLRKKGEEVNILVSYKIDGVPIEAEIDVESGKILSAVTRGDEDAGVDLTELYEHRKFEDLDEYFSDKKIGVKFEQILTFDNLKELSKRKNQKYKNVRNGLGAILRDKKGKKYSDLISLIPLELESKTFGGTKSDAIDALSTISEIGLEYTIIGGTKKDILKSFAEYRDHVLERRSNLPYQIDGLVVEYLDKDLRKHYGRKNRTWDYQRAFKFPANEQDTELKYVEFNIGHTGKLSLIAVYDQVDFGVCVNDRASIGSYKKFKKLNLHKGDKLRIGYNNDVIPFIKKNMSEGSKQRGGKIVMPEKCPECNEPLSFINDEKNDVYCVNPECPAVVLGKLVNFLNRLGVKDLNEKTVKKLYKAGLVKDFDDFFTLTKSDFEKLEKIKSKAAERLINAIKELTEKSYTEAELVYALCLNDIGEETANSVLSKYPLDSLLEKGFNFDQLEEIENMGKKKIKKFKQIKGYREVINQLRDILTVTPLDYEVDNSGKGSVVFSGFRDKNFEKLLKMQGWKISDSVTKSTKMLFVRDKSEKTAKIKKAKEMGGILIVEYDPNATLLENNNNILAAAFAR